MARGKSSFPSVRLALAALALILAACTNTSMPPPRELAGRYELVGVMEMGSQLLLHEQGTFEAVLYYGSLDIQGRGRWAMVDGQIELRERGAEGLFRQDETCAKRQLPARGHGHHHGMLPPTLGAICTAPDTKRQG